MFGDSYAAVPRTGRISAVLATAFVLSSCAAASPGAGATSTAEPVTGGRDLPSAHIHGMAVNPGTGQVLLATHDGLFDVSTGAPEQVGPAIDLMGFAAAGNGRYYASGHPAPATGLPEPAGLLGSEDGGRTWQSLALGGQSDFHALAATRGGIVGFDGALKTTTDLTTWTVQDAGFTPRHLSGSPGDSVVLATTEAGVRRSEDGGKTWTAPGAGPVLLLTAFGAGATAVGVAPDGAVHLSRDAGKTWDAAGSVAAQPAAIAAAGSDETVEIWVATHDGVEYSNDGGRTFTSVPG